MTASTASPRTNACPPGWRAGRSGVIANAGSRSARPPRQRAVLVLRYWEEFSQAETAELLGCAEGTVKSAAARGLRRLRELTAPWDDHRPQLTEKM